MVIEDKKLSWKAKGIYLEIIKLSKTNQATLENLQSRSSSGRTSTRSGIKELINNGYLIRVNGHKDGKFVGSRYVLAGLS